MLSGTSLRGSCYLIGDVLSVGHVMITAPTKRRGWSDLSAQPALKSPSRQITLPQSLQLDLHHLVRLTAPSCYGK